MQTIYAALSGKTYCANMVIIGRYETQVIMWKVIQMCNKVLKVPQQSLVYRLSGPSVTYPTIIFHSRKNGLAIYSFINIYSIIAARVYKTLQNPPVLSRGSAGHPAFAYDSRKTYKAK